MADAAAEGSSYKLSLLARRQRLPQLPGQETDTTYGVVWGACPLPAHGSCYVVKFEGAQRVSVLAYVDNRGSVFPVDKPITLEPEAYPAFAVSPDDNGLAGTVYVREGPTSLQPLSKYRGSFKGTMREVSDRETWNSTRSLTYRPFMATMYLRYCVFDRTRAMPSVLEPVSIDMTLRPLREQLDLMGPLAQLSLPDALDTMMYRVDEQEDPSGIERFARRVLGELDRDRLRALVQHENVQVAFIGHMDGFYLNFDHAAFTAEETAVLYAAETAINRLHRVITLIGAQDRAVSSSPSEEACSAYDQAALTSLTSWAQKLIDRAVAPNGWIDPGTVAARPGGEWDVRTRFAAACEGLNLIVRLEYDYRYDPDEHEMRVAFTVPQAASMPASRFDVRTKTWVTCDRAERAQAAQEYAHRMVLVLAAAAFSSSLSMACCVVEERDTVHDTATAVRFDRTEFMAQLLPLAREIEGMPLARADATERLKTSLTTERLHTEVPSARYVAPREDTRTLSPTLRDVLLADTARELEVMEDPNDPFMKRYNQLRAQEAHDAAAAERGLIELIEELEARCAAAELMSDGPVITRFCENHLGRILLPILEERRDVRILRVPDALFFARYELCKMYTNAEAYERALPEAQKLLDIATTSMQAYSMLVNVLSRLGRYQEVVDVAKHGLRVAYDRDSIAYLFYRVAFAYWMLGDRETAAACYRLVLRGEYVSNLADEELTQLLGEMGRSERPSLQEARERAEQAGIVVPPSPEAAHQVADAAVLLTDEGFYYLASRCVYHMWRIVARDELSAVHRSLQP